MCLVEFVRMFSNKTNLVFGLSFWCKWHDIFSEWQDIGKCTIAEKRFWCKIDVACNTLCKIELLKWRCSERCTIILIWHFNNSLQLAVRVYLVCDPTIRQPGFDLPRQQWSLLNRFRTEQEHCGVCRRKWRLTDTDLCPCGETPTMSHIVESCPLTKLNGGLSRLHSADEDAVSWLTNYGKWHAFEKKKNHRGTNRIAVVSLVLFTFYVVRLYGIPQPRVIQ